MNIEQIKKNINKIIPLSKTNLFYKNKLILSSNTLVYLKKDIRSQISNPKKDKSVFVIRLKYDPEDLKSTLVINCSKKILTPNLDLINVVGTMKTVIYTSDDLDEIGFNKKYLNKIIKVLDKRLLGKNITSSIREVIEID